MSQTKEHSDESSHCKLWFEENKKKKTEVQKGKIKDLAVNFRKQNVFTEKVNHFQIILKQTDGYIRQI